MRLCGKKSYFLYVHKYLGSRINWTATVQNTTEFRQFSNKFQFSSLDLSDEANLIVYPSFAHSKIKLYFLITLKSTVCLKPLINNIYLKDRETILFAKISFCIQQSLNSSVSNVFPFYSVLFFKNHIFKYS